LKLSSHSPKGEQTIKASIAISNTDKYDSDEVVQSYIWDVVGSITRPVKELKSFQKIFLKAGETKTVTFDITPEDLKFYNYELEYVWEPGDFEIMIRGNSRDIFLGKVNWKE